MPILPRVTGALLILAWSYLTYYWMRIRYGPKATLASDPVVAPVSRFTARLQTFAEGRGGVVVVSAAIVVAAAVVFAWYQRRRSVPPPSGPRAPEEVSHGS
jgi:hypothetical protein